MVRGVKSISLVSQGRRLTLEMPGWYCEASNDSVHTREDMAELDRAIVALELGEKT